MMKTYTLQTKVDVGRFTYALHFDVSANDDFEAKTKLAEAVSQHDAEALHACCPGCHNDYLEPDDERAHQAHYAYAIRPEGGSFASDVGRAHDLFCIAMDALDEEEARNAVVVMEVLDD